MANTTKILFNDFVAIERDLNNIIPTDDVEVYSGTVKAVSTFVNQIAENDIVLYKKTSSYSEDGNPFDLAHESDVYFRNPVVDLP